MCLNPPPLEFHGIDATPALLRELRSARPAALLLRRRNVESPAQVRELTGALRRELGEALEIAVRHEGGAETPFVDGVTFFPDLAALEAAADPELSREVGRVMGRELGALGITRNLVESQGPAAQDLLSGFAETVRSGEEADDADAELLATQVAEAALQVAADPGALLPLAPGRKLGMIVPRLGDVADRLAVERRLRSTAALLRPRVGAGVGVLETPVQADARTATMAAEWAAAQEAVIVFSLDPARFPGQQRMLDALRGCPRRIIVALSPSDDASRAGEGATRVLLRGFQRVQLLAAMLRIFPPAPAERKRPGRPPVSLV